VVGFCERSHDPSGSIKGGVFLDIRVYTLPSIEHSAPMS
jgi:hypothetical protein